MKVSLCQSLLLDNGSVSSSSSSGALLLVLLRCSPPAPGLVSDDDVFRCELRCEESVSAPV